MKTKLLALMVVVGGLFLGGMVFSADWPGWRGPQRNGVVPESPPLLDVFPEGGAKKLWESEELHAAGNQSYGCVTVADGCAYLYLNWGFNVPKDDRVLTMGNLNGHGYAPDTPADLLKAVEEARVSDARKNLKTGKEIDPWVNEWLKANMKPEQKKFQGVAQARLRAGPAALPLDLLAKLATIADKVFPNQEAFDQWFKDNGIDDATMKQATKGVVKTKPAARDFVACLDAATGKTLWKVEVDAKKQAFSASSTPAVAGGRLYVLTSAGVVYCLDAKTGKEVWKKQPFEKPADSHCSVLLVDGVVVVNAASALGLDAQTGEVLWQDKKLAATCPSPALWKTGDKTCVIVQGRQLTCLEPKTGKVMWTVPGVGSSTPAVSGDFLAYTAGKKLIAYKLSADKAEKLWEIPFGDEYTSPLIYKDHVYALGAIDRNSRQGRGVCVELATGKIVWETPLDAYSCSSPLVADDKLIALGGGQVLLIKASPDKYTLLGKAALHKGDIWTSPSLADGKLFLRVGTRVACFDLHK